MRLVFVMDPIGQLDIEADTTFVLMLEAQKRGHEVLYAAPEDLGVSDGRASALVHPVTLRREKGNHVDMGAAHTVILDEGADVVLQRVDPPVDGEYVVATQILGLCERAQVWNRPSSILAYNEKLLALHFRDLMPETIVARQPAELLGFMNKLGGEMILKPLDGKGGEGVFHLRRGDRNLFSILEQSTRFGARAVMAQRYLPEIREGDKRILLLEGEPLGALLRVPSESEVRANLHVGGRGARASLDDADRRIIERLAPLLRRDGLFFVGIDVIGGLLTEVNLTSPTGMQEIDALDGVRLEEQLIERLETRFRESEKAAPSRR
ncbi:MAG: glutathione synthase [Proteobacteria bacterium]|nr:glutathione synthase [Pseudomonadota bacterium]